jgi:hypothetical protein
LPAAIKRAAAGAWSTPPSLVQIADLRALCAHTVFCISALAGSVSFIASSAHCKADPTQFAFATDEHEQAARTLAASMMILAGPGAKPSSPVVTVAYDGQGGAEGWPVIIAIIAVCVAVSAVAAAYMSEDASQVIDRKLAREEDSKRLIAAQAKAVDLVEQHLAAEAAQGKPASFSDEEKAVLNDLKQTQVAITSKKEPPLVTAKDTISSWMGGVFDGGLATAALIFGGLWWLATKKA